MKYPTKVFHEVNDYPMSITNAIAQQELNDSESKKKEEQAITKLPINFRSFYHALESKVRN